MSLQQLQDIGLSSTSVSKFTYETPVDVVKSEAFAGNSSLTSVTILSAAEVEDNSFVSCNNLLELTLPGIPVYSSSTLADDGESKPASLETINILEGTTEIGTLLSGLRSLKNAYLPSTLESFAKGSLDKCYSLVELDVPEDASFAEGQFKDTRNLDHLKFKMSRNNKDIGLSGLMANSTLTAVVDSIIDLSPGLFAKSSCSSITFETEPGMSIASLGTGAFKSAQHLVQLDLSEQESLEVIPEEAFADCAQLIRVTLPSSVKSLGFNCFKDDPSLILSLPSQLTSIYNLGLDLKGVAVPPALQVVGPSAFMFADVTDDVVSLPSISQAGSYAFSQSNIKNAQFGSALTSVSPYLFSGSASLTAFSFDSVREVKQHAFDGTSLASTLASQIDMTSVQKYETYSMANITSDLYIKMSPQIVNIGNFTSDVFAGSNVKQIDISQLTNKEFDKLSTLAGGSLIPVSRYADDVIVVYKRVKSMLGCNSDFTLVLKDITFDKDGELAEYACLKYADPDKKVLSYCDPAEDDYIDFIRHPLLPSRVTMISPNAFKDQSQLTSIDIKNVYAVDGSAFAGCYNLRSITATAVENIGENAFDGCSALKAISMGSSLTSIGNYAFQNCTSMTDADISKAQYIGQYAFSSCTHLTSVTMNAVRTLSYMAFANCDALESVILPQTITKATSGKKAFYSCDSLLSVIIAGNPATLPDELVDNVPNILSVNIPGMSMNDVKEDLKTNRFSTQPHTSYFTSDKSGIYPSLVTKDISHVVPVTNGLVVDPLTLKVKGTDSSYAIWYVYESDLSDFAGLEDHAFNNCDIQIIQLPASWSASQWSCIGNGIFNTGKVSYARVNKDYNAANDNILYRKLFSDINSATHQYIKFNNGRLVSETQFISDSDPFLWDESNTIIVGVNDANVSATQAASVPDTAHGISSHAFEQTKFLKTLNISDRSSTAVVLSVSDDAFYNSYNLETVTFESAANIKLFSNTFRKACIKSIIMPSFLSVGGYGLPESYKLRNLTYSRDTQQVNASAMLDCKPILSSVQFQSGSELTSIGDYAFAELQDPFPNIEVIDFRECTKLKSIGEYAFYNSIQSTNDGALNFPSSISSISKAAFAYRNGYSDYHKISALDLDNSNIASIGPSAFMNNAFRKVTFGDNLTSIDTYAFARSTYKYDIDIPASVVSIGLNAFKNNVILNPDNLKYNVISTHTTLSGLSTMIGLDGTDGRNINEKFQATNTLGLSRNTVLSALDSPYESGFIITTAPDGNTHDTLYNFCPPYMSIDLMKRKLVRVDPSVAPQHVYMPVYLTASSPSALMDCSSTTQLCDFYDNETYYISCANDYEFCNCQQLSNVKLLSEATFIGERAFYNCDALTALYDAYDDDKWRFFKLSAIGPSAFMDCDNLRTFSICSSIVELCSSMFDNCPQLTSIDIDLNVDDFYIKFRKHGGSSTVKSTIREYFAGIAPGARCRINFRDAVYTNDGNIKLDPEFVKLRAYGPHGELSAISGLVFNGPHGEDIRNQSYINLSSVSMVDPFVFDGIDNLRNVNLLENEDASLSIYLSSIGEYAFYNCSRLNAVNGCKLSCADVGDYAFGKCPMLLDMQFDLSKLKRIGTGAFYGTSLNTLTFVDKTENNVDVARDKVINAINFNAAGNRNPLELPEGCMVYIKLSNDVTYSFNYLLDDLSSSVIDINRHAIVFTDKTTSSIKPLVLLEATQLTSIPALVANTYHANIIGRWK